MQELFRLVPRGIVARSLGAGVLYFLMQTGWLTWYAFDQCCATSDSNVEDCVWYVYKQVPSALPMAVVFAAGLMVFAQILDRLAVEIRPAGEVSDWRLKEWGTILFYVVVLVLIGLALTIFSDRIPVFVTLAVVAYVCSQPWILWVRRVVGSGP